ncbi:hypothetical protein ABLE68_21590 [Nocardioides sp. CN2-186]|uniref:DUF7144 family membrane protein n=1 Tax=Nocardioides tweenelious TaxID=3156607 RepID=UPI0032B37401
MADRVPPGERVWAEGIAIFAGTILATLGVFQVLEGLSAVGKDSVFVRTPNYLFDVDLTAWGWAHIIIGGVAVLVGVCLLLGQYWAMVAGICIAVISALANFAFIPYYPWWSLLLIAFDVMVIWALSTMMSQRH